jgi:glycosyltransferase involved in cell wall biosynthesis
MKIAFIHISKGIVKRGSEASVDHLAGYLSKAHDVSIFQSGDKQLQKKYSQIKIDIPFEINADKPQTLLGKFLDRLYLNKQNLAILFFSMKTLPYLIKNKYNILIPTNGFWQIIICKLAKLFTGAKIVVFGRAGIGFHDKDNILLKPDLFIALTKYAKNWADTINSRVKSIYIPNPINTDLFNPKVKPVFKKKLPIILTVAALTEYKRIDLVIKAVAKMKTKAFLLIAGEGELKEKILELGKRNLGKMFVIRKFSYNKMPGVFTSADVFTLVSKSQDAFPRVMLEAMASGNTIVVSEDPIKKEVIGEAGFYVDPNNTDQYAKMLDKALKTENNKDRIIKRAENYSVEKIGKILEKKLTKN